MAKKGTGKSDAQKADKWKELAEKRADKIIKGIYSLSKLSARSRYVYTPKQVQILKDEFENALNECFGMYEGQTKATKSGIKL